MSRRSTTRLAASPNVHEGLQWLKAIPPALLKLCCSPPPLPRHPLFESPFYPSDNLRIIQENKSFHNTLSSALQPPRLTCPNAAAPKTGCQITCPPGLVMAQSNPHTPGVARKNKKTDAFG
ncbi:hypothetical protein CDAR_381271 [Caerostris darwini]|uniref:Uncharacterized protein n=1 Tax=Caerostris darwini TaxID=1538125 RepID=A0AAV4RTW3_9ARAC|nr:hypothetical protein CDAR_381271 [Caerostris darwini]